MRRLLHRSASLLFCTNAACAAQPSRPLPDHGRVRLRAERPLVSVDDMAWLRPRRGEHAPPRSEGAGAATVHTDGVVAGHRVIRLLGSGARAAVYLGHSGNGSTVALKVFGADTEPASIELDIAVLTSTAAPGLVRLLDVAQLGDGRICLVLERLTGGSLARYLVDHPRLSPGEIVTLLAPVTVALHAMHTGGFSHGGVSQATILLDATGRAVLTGFGAVSHFSNLPRERIGQLRDDYERLGTVMATLCDSLDPSDSHRASAAVLLRRFQGAIHPHQNPPGAERADGGASIGSVLEVFEHDLFDWADAEPLRGFQHATRAGVNALLHEDTAMETAAPQFDGGRRRHTLLISQGADPIMDAGDNGFADDVTADITDDFERSGFDNESDGEFDRALPRGRGGQVGTALRALSGRGRDVLQDLQPKARLDRAFATAVDSVVGSVLDSHPLKAAGHALRKRLHGHQRPLLVAALVGAGMLVLALSLFPVPGRAGEAGTARTAGADGTAGTAEIPIAQMSSPAGLASDAAGADDTSTDQGDEPPVPHRPDAETLAAIAGDDPVAAVVALLARRSSCLVAASLVCLVDVDQTGSAMLALDSYDARERQQGGSGRDLADYVGYLPALAERTGDLAVIVLAPIPGKEKGQPASVLVVKGEGGWRLREIFDY